MKRFLVEETRFGHYKSISYGSIVIELPENADASEEALQRYFENADDCDLINWDGELLSDCEDTTFEFHEMENEEFESYVAAQSGYIMKEIKSLHKKLENLRAELVYIVNG